MSRLGDVLDAALAASIQDDLTDVFASASLSASIDYDRFNAGATPTVDEDTGVLSSPYTTTSNVPAYVGQWTAREVNERPLIRIGDLKCMFRKSSVTGALSTEDRVTFNSTRYEVVHIEGVKVAPGSGVHDLVLVALRTGAAGG